MSVWGTMSCEIECVKWDNNDEGIDTRDAAVLCDFGDDEGIGKDEEEEEEEDEEEEGEEETG